MIQKKEEKIVIVQTWNDYLTAGYTGINKFSRDTSNENLKNLMISKDEYEEYGSFFFKACPIGNV